MANYRHLCPAVDAEIDADSPEFEQCDCQIDSDGTLPKFVAGDRVLVLPLNLPATVIKQALSFDYPESFWGNVQVQYDDRVLGICNSWQLTKLMDQC